MNLPNSAAAAKNCFSVSRKIRTLLPLLLLFTSALACADPPEPTIADGSYAPEPGCNFTFWRLPGETSGPLAVYIHGGGFIRGTRKDMASLAAPTLKKGFAAMTIDYPFLEREPVQKILQLCARSVQYARANAKEWNIDPQRIVCIGGSAGAGASMWIAVHPDLADPSSTDTVARQSSRISGAGLVDTQLTYNVYRWEELVGYKEPLAELQFFSPITLYHFTSNDKTPPAAPNFQAMLKDVDMYGMIDANTPPLVLRNKHSPAPPTKTGDYIHHPRHAHTVINKAGEFNLATDYRPYDPKVSNPFLEVIEYFVAFPPKPTP